MMTKMAELHKKQMESEAHARVQAHMENTDSNGPSMQTGQAQSQQNPVSIEDGGGGSNTWNPASAGDKNDNMVRVAIYDISFGYSSWLSPILFCSKIDVAPHTGILIYGKEYFWGGGIQKVLHEDFVTQTGQKPVEYVNLGRTQIPEELFHDWIITVTPRFNEHTYNLMDHNCNNFSEEASQFLVGSGLPDHILDAPRKVKKSCLGMLGLWVVSLAPIQGHSSFIG